jgi:hypothetical protein
VKKYADLILQFIPISPFFSAGDNAFKTGQNKLNYSACLVGQAGIDLV